MTRRILADFKRGLTARGVFFMGVGRARGPHCGDECSLPLFPLAMIMQAEGSLARDAVELARGPDDARVDALPRTG